jgi:hypothetical protein
MRKYTLSIAFVIEIELINKSISKTKEETDLPSLKLAGIPLMTS